MNNTFPAMYEDQILHMYGIHINKSYINFLQRFGMDRVGVKAEGVFIYDSKGTGYLDCVGGYGIFNLGHNHPDLTESLKDQIDKKEPYTKPFITEIQIKLAEKLAAVTPGDLECSFFCNSGSEAIDSAIKLARLCTGKKEIITAKNAFHGYTFGALSASGISSFKKLFEPLVPGIVQVPFTDIQAVKKAVTPETSAVLLEPVQHEAGIAIPSDSYLKDVRKLCDDKNILMILDEIKTGFGKTGRMFACEHFDVVPDILVLGKSLGGGLMPVGAIIANRKVWRKFGLSFPMSASSYAGNALASRVALETINIIQEYNLIHECARNGKEFLEQLKHCKRRYPDIIRSVKGIGLLIGIETQKPAIATGMVKAFFQSGIIALPAYGSASVIMIEPPLIITFDQLNRVLLSIEHFCEKSVKIIN